MTKCQTLRKFWHFDGNGDDGSGDDGNGDDGYGDDGNGDETFLMGFTM